MKIARRVTLLFAVSLAFLPPAQAASQAQMARDCDAEVERVEKRIVQARKKPEYRSEQGRQALSTADRWLSKARQHAAKGESRHCLEAARKGRAQVSGR